VLLWKTIRSDERGGGVLEHLNPKVCQDSGELLWNGSSHFQIMDIFCGSWLALVFGCDDDAQPDDDY